MISGPIASRIGPRSLAPDDARFKLDRIYQTELVERQGALGPMCFGPRIMGELAPYCFQLAHGTRTYNGSTKPEYWLEDYSTAVNIARGNLRWAVRYVPQKLEGPARIWLNNLPAGSINGWMDFEEQFVSNFTSTYERPNLPQQLANCRQGDYETDHDYLTRWCTLRNSCEGVVEQQAIMWFAQGCQNGTMLWQKLQREMPATMAETIKICGYLCIGRPIASHP
jgi:hypothetical protein